MIEVLVGIPWKDGGRDRAGCDCYGLFRLAFLAETGIELPAYSEHMITAADCAAVSAMIHGELGPWREVPAGSEQRGDGVLIRLGRHASHIAIVAGNGRLLHIDEGGSARLERYRNFLFASRIVGFYRHEALIPT